MNGFKREKEIEVQLASSVESQAKTTDGDERMLWWGRIEGLVCLHLASGLVLDVEVKLILLKFWRG